MGIITLTSDFGQQDTYVAAMKGVILSVCPSATLVDITHDIPPQDVREGAFALHAASGWFPAGTVHLAVVDPGVGTERRAVAVQTERAVYVAPDNGLLSYVLAHSTAYQAVALTNPAFHRQPVSPTFHGRDIFAPAAAHLCAGIPLASLGPAVTDLQLFSASSSRWDADGSLVGEVVHVDRFGNLVTSIGERDGAWDRFVFARVGGSRVFRFVCTYAEAEPGELVALIGSTGHLEIAERNGSATARLAARAGDAVRVVFREQA